MDLWIILFIAFAIWLGYKIKDRNQPPPDKQDFDIADFRVSYKRKDDDESSK